LYADFGDNLFPCASKVGARLGRAIGEAAMAVNITIACTHCRKEYSVPDSLIGRRVKCKECCEVFVAPEPQVATSGVDLSVLEQLEPAAYVPPPITSASPRGRVTAAPGFATGNAVEAAPLVYAAPIRARRQRFQAPGPLDDLIHDKLPLLLILVGYVLPITVSLIRLIRLDLGWRPMLGALVLLGCFVGIAIPMTVTGLRIAAHVMNFELVPSPGYRIVAALSATWIAMFLYAEIVPPTFGFQQSLLQIIAGIMIWLVIGMIIGVIASFGFIWLFFRLRFGEAVVTWLFAGLAYFLGTLGSIGITVLILWVLAQAFPITDESAGAGASNASASSAPIGGPVFSGTPRDATARNLNQLYLFVEMYFNAHKQYPPSLESLVQSDHMDSELLRSPFGPSGATDYLYCPFPVPRREAGHDYLLVVDQAEGPTDQGMTVVRGDGTIEFLTLDRYAAASLASKHYADEEYQKYIAEQTPPPDSTPPVAISPPQSPPAPDSQPSATPPPPIEPAPPIDDTIIPAHAWTAAIDPPDEQPQISSRLRHIFPVGGVFYFPPQPSNFMLLSRHDPTDKLPDKYPDELWNLKTLVKVSQFDCIPITSGGVLSPDGKLFAIRSLGGQDLATAYQIYSTRTGKLTHTLNGPPMVGKTMPTPIGFVGDEQLVTLGDDFDVWDIKQELGLHHFGDRNTIDATTLVAVSANGKLLATLTGGETLSMYSTQSGKLLGQTPIPDLTERKSESASPIRTLAFSPDGRELALLLNGQHIYVWSVADGSLAARFSLKHPIGSAGAKADGAVDSMAWTPDSQGWLLGGDHIVDRMTGVGIYAAPDFHEQGAKEIGLRQIIDDGHILIGFQAEMGNRLALEAFPIDSAVIEKNRTSMRALVPAATAPSTDSGSP
jgi:WD40 repeat protein